MNNNLYHWHDEHAVRHEMHEMDRAVQQARLLREAGLGGPGWLTRAADAVHTLRAVANWLVAAGKRLQGRRSIEPGTFSKKSPRYV